MTNEQIAEKILNDVFEMERPEFGTVLEMYNAEVKAISDIITEATIAKDAEIERLKGEHDGYKEYKNETY